MPFKEHALSMGAGITRWVQAGSVICKRYEGSFRSNELRRKAETGLWYTLVSANPFAKEGEGTTPLAAISDAIARTESAASLLLSDFGELSHAKRLLEADQREENPLEPEETHMNFEEKTWEWATTPDPKTGKAPIEGRVGEPDYDWRDQVLARLEDVEKYPHVHFVVFVQCEDLSSPSRGAYNIVTGGPVSTWREEHLEEMADPQKRTKFHYGDAPSRWLYPQWFIRRDPELIPAKEALVPDENELVPEETDDRDAAM